jgi:microcystin-dependent protein
LPALTQEALMSGTGQPFNNLQPSLAVNMVMSLSGVFPSGGGGGSATGDMLGFIYDFAGNFDPGDSLMLQGQLLSISTNEVLYNLIGTTYGGDGVTTFALPDFQGTAAIGVGTGAGLSTQTLGVPTGSATIALSASQLPPNDPSLPGGGDGGGQSFSNLQPSLPVQALIATSGVFPSEGGDGGSAAFIGQVAYFAGNFIPAGWTAADGQLISITSNEALYNLIGTTYGGDGVNTFALPDLQGRVAVGADAADPLGTEFGQDATTLTAAQLPGGGVAGSTSPGQPVNNDQPSLALTYIIATSGIFPPNGSGAGFNTTTPTLGEIAAFAGNFAPSGWALCDGQLLSISANTALYDILGTQYGGDGVTTFALPDLQGRTPVGSGTNSSVTYNVGDTVGSDTNTLAVANLPPEDQPACFRAGTRIATPDGDVAVQALSVNGHVCLAHGGTAAIVWVGRRRVNCMRHRRPHSVWPVRIAPGAFGRGVPRRDLWLSPDHAVLLDDVLVPVKHLIDGEWIVQVPVNEVMYFHIELPRHGVLLAEGLSVESYLEAGDRANFGNGGESLRLHPDFSSRSWEAHGCAPLVVAGPRLAAVRARLAMRSYSGMPARAMASSQPVSA